MLGQRRGWDGAGGGGSDLGRRMPSPNNTDLASLAWCPGGVITGIERGRGRSKPVAVSLDGVVVCQLARTVVEQAGLEVGQCLSHEDLRLLIEQDSQYRARDKALRLLAVRDRACREMEQKLAAAGFSAAIVAGTVGWLVERGLLDDVRFASQFAAEKRRLGWSTRRIRNELLRKGVEREAIDQVLAGGVDTPDTFGGGATGVTELEVAVALARRRFGREFGSDAAAATRKVVGFLARRGFDWDDIQKAMRLLAEDARQDETPLDPDSLSN